MEAQEINGIDEKIKIMSKKNAHKIKSIPIFNDEN